MFPFGTRGPGAGNTGTEAIKRGQFSIRMRQKVIRSILFLVSTIFVGLMSITIVGCGNGDTPSQVVEKFYKYTQENDCQKVADLVIEDRPSYDSYINTCKQYADKLVSYSIKGETIGGTNLGRNSAMVDTEVTLKEDQGEKTFSAPQFLIKQDDDWKLIKAES